MGTPTRFPSGITNVVKTSSLGMFTLPDPSICHQFFTDFDQYAAGDWTLTSIGTTGTAALTALDGGNLLVTNTAADNDGTQLQRNPASFLLAAGKRAWFKARFKVSDATQSDLAIGLIVIDTTILGATAGAGVTDGIFFSKDDGSTSLDIQCQKNATTGQTRKAAIATIVDDTFLSIAWYYDGVSELKYFVNDVHLGTLSATSAYLPDVILSPSFALLNGEGAAKTMTIDYIFAAKER